MTGLLSGQKAEQFWTNATTSHQADARTVREGRLLAMLLDARAMPRRIMIELVCRRLFALYQVLLDPKSGWQFADMLLPLAGSATAIGANLQNELTRFIRRNRSSSAYTPSTSSTAASSQYRRNGGGRGGSRYQRTGDRGSSSNNGGGSQAGHHSHSQGSSQSHPPSSQRRQSGAAAAPRQTGGAAGSGAARS